MSGWPWMKGCSVEQQNAGQVDDSQDDERPVVRDLIREHRDLIDQMAAALSSSENEESYDATKHDDLWCLRFLLSHKKNLPKAIQAAKTTLVFRREHGLDELGDIRETAPQNAEIAAWQRFRDSGGVSERSILYTVPDLQRGGVLTFFDIGSMDPHKLAKLSVDDWIASIAYMNEWNYQWLDYLTRTTGRLTKSVRIVDVGTARLSQIDLTCQDRYTKAIATMQDCFPQAVQCIYVCYAPAWIYVPWKTIRPYLPVRVVSKMDFLDPSVAKDRQRLLHATADSPEHLPTRFGGANETLLCADTTTTNSLSEDANDENNDEFLDAVPSLEETVSVTSYD